MTGLFDVEAVDADEDVVTYTYCGLIRMERCSKRLQRRTI